MTYEYHLPVKTILSTYCSCPPHHHQETGPQQDHPALVYPAYFLSMNHLPANKLAFEEYTNGN
jgi:hypothetical protein